MNAISNNLTFYTDSNGLEMQQRVWDKRPNYNYITNAITSSSYYPVTSAIVIVDKN